MLLALLLGDETLQALLAGRVVQNHFANWSIDALDLGIALVITQLKGWVGGCGVGEVWVSRPAFDNRGERRAWDTKLRTHQVVKDARALRVFEAMAPATRRTSMGAKKAALGLLRGNGRWLAKTHVVRVRVTRGPAVCVETTYLESKELGFPIDELAPPS